MNVTTDGAESDFDQGATARTSVRWFARANTIGAVCALAIVVVVNAFIVQDALMWLLAAALVVAAAALAFAGRVASDDRPLRALALITGADWLVALVTPIALPFLWPAMAIVAVLPLVLAAPFVSLRTLSWMIALAAGVTAGVAAIGLQGDDSGAIPDIGDEVELAVVIGAIAVLMIPIGLVVWLHNRSQQEALDEALRLNAELGRSEAQLAASRRRVVEAGDAARSRIERDLHDGAQQRLVAIGMKARLLASQVPPEAAGGELVGQLVSDVADAVGELRELAHGIYPPVLEAHGVGEALTAAGRRSPGRVVVANGLGSERLDRPIEEALYFTALEAMTNASKHAGDGEIRVVVGHADDAVELRVEDDGPGIVTDQDLGDLAHAQSGGLASMRDRIEALGGTFTLESGGRGGLTVRALVTPS